MTGLHILRRCLGARGGTTSIEFAITAMAFLMLLLGAVEVGRAMWIRNSVQFATQEAARWAIVRPTASTTQIQDFALQRLTAIGQTGATATATFETSGGRRYVVVTASSPFLSASGIVPVGPITLLGQTRLPVS